MPLPTMSASKQRDVRQRHTLRMDNPDTLMVDVRREHERITAQAGGGCPCTCLNPDQVSDESLLEWCTLASAAYNLGTSALNCLCIGIMLGMMGQTPASSSDFVVPGRVPRLPARDAQFWLFRNLCAHARALLLGWESPARFRNLWVDCHGPLGTSVVPHIQHGLCGALPNRHVPEELASDVLRMVDERVACECLYEPIPGVLVHNCNEQDGAGVAESFFPEWQRLHMLEAIRDEAFPTAQAEWREHTFIMPRSFVLSSLYIYCKTKYESQIQLHASKHAFLCRKTFDKLVSASYPNLTRCKHHTGICDKCMEYHRQLKEDLGDQEAWTVIEVCAHSRESFVRISVFLTPSHHRAARRYDNEDPKYSRRCTGSA